VIYLGSDFVGDYWVGSVSEVVMQATANASDLAAVVASQRSYYSTP